jgi:hypothetical protein
MTKRPYEGKLHIDMPFVEAVERFIGTKPAETQANITRSKKKKPPGGKLPSGGKVEGENVVDLRHRRMRKRNHGR